MFFKAAVFWSCVFAFITKRNSDRVQMLFLFFVFFFAGGRGMEGGGCKEIAVAEVSVDDDDDDVLERSGCDWKQINGL